MDKVQIQKLNPQDFQFQGYVEVDESLITSYNFDTSFVESTDYIEYYVYDENQNLIYPDNATSLIDFTVLNGDVIINPQIDLEKLGFDDGVYNIGYNFYRKLVGSSIEENYFIKEISTDRTEIRLDSNDILFSTVISSSKDFEAYRENSTYFVDFYLNLGKNRKVIANNFVLDEEDLTNPTILIKLYQPLPTDIDVKTKLWLVEEISSPQLYKAQFINVVTPPQDFTEISSPNFHLEVNQEKGNTSAEACYNDLINNTLTSSYNQISSLLQDKEISINIDYENFGNFINFSSAKTRLENFYYKIQQLEVLKESLTDTISTVLGNTRTSTTFLSSEATLNSQIKEIINSFDGYERFLYYDSGSQYSWPKSTNTPPYQLQPSDSTEVINWLGNSDEISGNFGGLALSASNYDNLNPDYLRWSIPEYLLEDNENEQYGLFIDMMGQHYDNVWVYVKDITNKFDNDNRLNFGISKDLVADALKDFGIKLYSNKYNNDDLYTSLLGYTLGGSLFPINNLDTTLPATSGYDYVDTKVSASNDIVPLNELNKRVYKRIYHNLPYLFKTKGTKAGLRALVNTYGIPNTILRINEFGGKDKNENIDWDFAQDKFNYAFNTSNDGYVGSSFNLNVGFDPLSLPPNTVQFRFKPDSIPPVGEENQILWAGRGGAGTAISAVLLEYSPLNYLSGSYSGSVLENYSKYATLKFIPNISSSISSSVYLPFYNEGWWSVMVGVDYEATSSNCFIHAANKESGNLQFSQSNFCSESIDTYQNIVNSTFPSPVTVTYNTIDYIPLNGQYQEIRYYAGLVSESAFYDYTLNPYSIESGVFNNAENTLAFRAPLGTILDADNPSPLRTSIHPRVTGSSEYIIPSFDDGSSVYSYSKEEFNTNVEKIYQDQVIGGIKNRVTEKIRIKDNNLPVGDVLSPLRSLEQLNLEEGSYSPPINYIEVGYSPTNEINDDINSQIGYFNIGEYIGNPSANFDLNRNYPDLDVLRDEYFKKYIKSYDIRDFVRLMKFFDNSLFKMIKDFVPARTSLTSGVIVKQHLLERNKQPQPQVSSEDNKYEALIKPQSRNYSTGSSDSSQYDYNNGSSIYTFKGGTGGSFERFNGLQTSPSQSQYGLGNQFDLTQSYTETKKGKLGQEEIEVYNQHEFFDGEFSGSCILVTDLDLNPDCNPYTTVPDTPLRFNPLIFNSSGNPSLGSTVSTPGFTDPFNTPNVGDVWFLTTYNVTNQSYEITHIKLPNIDLNGNNISDIINYDLGYLEFIFSEGNKEFYIIGFQQNSSNIVIVVDQNQGDYIMNPLTDDRGSENWSLDINGTFKYDAGAYTPYMSQGVLTDQTLHQRQYFQYWDGSNLDALSLMNIGTSDFTSGGGVTYIEENFEEGCYNSLRSSNIPWIISASLEYSASDVGTGNQATTNGVYHTGSDLIQNISFSTGTTSSYYPNTRGPNNVGFRLDPSYFHIEYWSPTQPGNFVDETPLPPPETGKAGHPPLRYAGTASFDFYFDSLDILPPLASDATSEYRPFEGTTILPSNANFIGFEDQDYPYPGATTASLDTDGSLEVKVDYIFNEALVRDFGMDFAFGAQLDAGTWGDDGAELVFRYTRDPLNWATDDSNIFYTKLIPNSGLVQTLLVWLNLEWFQSRRRGGDLRDFWFRPEIKATPSFNYNIINWDVRIGYKPKSDPPGPIDTFVPVIELTQGSSLSEFNQGQEGGLGVVYSDVRAKLKYTSSLGEIEITSSLPILNQELTSLTTLSFPDSPILATTPHISTVVSPTSSYYFVEYEFTNITGSGRIIPFGGDLEYPELLITQSITIDPSDWQLTCSVHLYKGDTTNDEVTLPIPPVFPYQADPGVLLTSSTLIVPNASSTGVLDLNFSYQGDFGGNENYRLAINVEKTWVGGVEINAHTMSIHPNTSPLSPINLPYEYGNYRAPTSSIFILPTFFGNGVLPFQFALDCQPLLNNFVNSRLSSWLMDVDYSTDPYIPTNIELLLADKALKATTPDSNYSILGLVNSRYNGAKSTSNRINVWTPQDEGTYGKNPVLELRTAYFGYFDSLKDPYPNINDKINLNLTYLIDEQGNAIPPSLEGVGLFNLIQSFPEKGLATISISSGSNELRGLDSLYPANIVGKTITPIMYSQTSSIGYASSLPLTGSGRISLYDNDNVAAFDDYSFTAEGSSSLSGLPNTSFTQSLDPTENVTTKPYTDANPYLSGVITFPNGDPGIGDNLADVQNISLETSVVTSFLYRTPIRESMNLKLSLINDGNNIPFILSDVSLKVHQSSGTVTNLGSVLSSDNDVIRFINSQGRYNIPTNVWGGVSSIIPTTQQPLLNSNNQAEMVVVSRALDELLVQRGLYRRGDGGVENKGTITGLEWVFKANSNNYQFKKNTPTTWKLEGNLVPSDTIQSVFYPVLYSGSILPTKISNMGAKSHLLSGDNAASVPYWVFSGSSHGGTDIFDQAILVMSSSNMNEAYGGSHYQGELPYVPGPSEYHPGGVEPKGTRFDNIIYPLELEVGDEIRFGNNENYSYKIKRVIPPQQNIEDDGIGRLKITLDGRVPTSINKDFFLVRRYLDKANSVFLGANYPYTNPPSASTAQGILFPEFPVESLQVSASAIVENLVGKGVIK